MNKNINLVWLFSVSMILVFIGVALDAKPKDYGDVDVELVRVHDGDTIVVNIPKWPDIIGKEIGVRVLGIDAPEMHDVDPIIKSEAEKAKMFASGVLNNAKNIKLVGIKRDKYFRILAFVFADGNDLSQKMLDSGLAKPYDGGTKQIWTEEDIQKLEREGK